MFGQLLGDPNKRKLKSYTPIVSDINLIEEDIAVLSDEDLRNRTYDLRQRLEKPKSFSK